MTYNCDNLKRDPKFTLLYEEFARQLLEKNLKPNKTDFKTLLSLAEWPSALNQTFTSEADTIIKPVIKAVQAYHDSFKKNIKKALAQVNEVGKSNPQAISIFNTSMSDINENVKCIQQLTLNAQTQLNKLRETTAKEISQLGTGIQQLEIDQKNIKTKIKLLQDEINSLSKQLNDLNWAWLACIIIILCPWLPILIQEVALNKSAKQKELSQKTSQLNQLNTQLTHLKTKQENLRIKYNTSAAILTSTQNANGLCIYILNNISGIFDALQAIDPNETPMMLQRMLSVLNQNWDDLLSEINLLSATSNIN